MQDMEHPDRKKVNKRKKRSILPFIMAAGLGALAVLVVINVLLYLHPLNGGRASADASTAASAATVAATGQADAAGNASSETWTEEVYNALPKDLEEGEQAVGDVGNVVIPMEGTLPEKKPDWESLTKENPDIYAWIVIPGAGVDAPVLQKSTEANYYDVHDAKGQNSIYGCVHSDIGNELDFTDPNTVIYGSSAQKGQQFYGLSAFEDKSFFEQNRYIYIYTKDKTYEYRVFAAYTGKDEDILRTYNFYDINEFTAYIGQVYQSRDMSANFDTGYKDKVIATWNMITLSADEADGNGRYIVQASLSGETQN